MGNKILITILIAQMVGTIIDIITNAGRGIGIILIITVVCHLLNTSALEDKTK